MAEVNTSMLDFQFEKTGKDFEDNVTDERPTVGDWCKLGNCKQIPSRKGCKRCHNVAASYLDASYFFLLLLLVL